MGDASLREGARYRYLPLLSWVLVILAGALVLRYWLARPSTTHRKRLAAFSAALRLIPRHYAGEVNEQQLYEAAMRGMLQSLGDPYSAFLRPYEVSEAGVQTEGEFGGIGVEVMPRDGGAIVTAVQEDGPAAAAGIRPGDQIVGVDGRECGEMSFLELVSRIRGKVGTRVSLSIERADSAGTLTVELKRARIVLESVRWKMIEPGIGYVQIRQFDAHCPAKLREGLQKLKASGRLEALLLDVRGNRGGLLGAAVKVCDMFLSGGPIARVESRVAGERQSFTASAATVVPPELPMAVLVDGLSASAAEVMAGALQSNGRATVVGLRTIGKGAVNRIYVLPDGSGIVLTVAHYTAGRGVAVEGRGIEPDVEVGQLPPPPKGEDPHEREQWLARLRAARQEQLEAALELLRAKIH